MELTGSAFERLIATIVARTETGQLPIMEDTTQNFLTTPFEAVTTSAANVVAARRSTTDMAVPNYNNSPLSGSSRNSCDRCHQSKVRCDRLMPCQRCRKAGVACSFSRPVQVRRGCRRQTKGCPDKFLDRLSQLEHKVKGLSTRVNNEVQGSREYHQSFEESIGHRQRSTTEVIAPTLSSGLTTYAERRVSATFPKRPTQSQPRRLIPKVDNETRRHVLGNDEHPSSTEETSWQRVSEETMYPRGDLVKEGTSNRPNRGVNSSAAVLSSNESQTNCRALSLNTELPNRDLHSLHPLSSQIPFLWEVFKENVDPLLKVLHLPSMNQRIRTIMHDPRSLTPEMEALMFAIYYAAIGSMEDDEVSTDFGVQKSYLVRNFRSGTEQALLKVDYLNNSTLTVLQALTLFLVASYRTEDSLFYLALTSLIIRLNQSLGIYAGGSQFSALCPFEVEMRRRLWWTACILDWSYSEHDGTDFIIAARAFCPAYPTDINDADISLDMERLPCARSGWTDMTFCNIQYRICSLARQVYVAADQAGPFSLDANLTLQVREELILAAYEPVRQQCLRLLTNYDGEWGYEVDIPTVIRFVEASMRFIAFRPLQLSVIEQQLDMVRDLVLSSSVELVHCLALIFSDSKYKRYRWALQSSTHLQAIGYLVLDLSCHPWYDQDSSNRSALETVCSNPKLWKQIKFPNHAMRKIMAMTAVTTCSDNTAFERSPKTASDQSQAVLSLIHGVLSQEHIRTIT